MEILDPAGKMAILICDFCGANSAKNPDTLFFAGNTLGESRVAICGGCGNRVSQMVARIAKEAAEHAAKDAVAAQLKGTVPAKVSRPKKTIAKRG